MENPSYKIKNIEKKFLNKMRENQFLMVKNSVLELKKDFIGLKGRKSKDREVAIKREIEELFFKTMIMSIYDMDKFEQKEMKKIKG